MECHKCEYRGHVEAGVYRRIPFEETPCAKCELRDNSGNVIEFDEDRGPGTDAVAALRLAGSDTLVPLSVLSEAITELLMMPVELRDLVSWRYAGITYGEIGAAQGLSARAVENRLRRGMRQWPALRAIFVLKAAKQKRRKPHWRSA